MPYRVCSGFHHQRTYHLGEIGGRVSLEESIYLRELLRRYRERGSSFHEGFELTQLENEVLDDSTWIPCEVMSGMVNDTDELVIHREKHGKEVQQGVVARHGPALP